jgi:hypothetical protein
VRKARDGVLECARLEIYRAFSREARRGEAGPRLVLQASIADWDKRAV